MGNAQTTDNGETSESTQTPASFNDVNPEFAPVVTISSEFEVGQAVTTPYGVSTVTSLREDGIIIVTPTTWKLANGKPPMFFMNAKDVKLYAESVTIGQTVRTPYGVSICIEAPREDGILTVQPVTWNLATGKPPIFYMNPKDITPFIVAVEPPEGEVKAIEKGFHLPHIHLPHIHMPHLHVPHLPKVHIPHFQIPHLHVPRVTIPQLFGSTEQEPEKTFHSLEPTEQAPVSSEEEAKPTEEEAKPTEEEAEQQSEPSPIDSEAAPAVDVKDTSDATKDLSLVKPVPAADLVPQAEPAIPVAPEVTKPDVVKKNPEPTSPTPKIAVSPVRRRGSFSILQELELKVTPDMFLVKPELEASASMKEAALATGKDLLIGWQIQIKTEVSSSDNGIRVITASKKLPMQSTVFALASSASDEQKVWTALKRTDQKSGIEFRLMRKVIEIKA